MPLISVAQGPAGPFPRSLYLSVEKVIPDLFPLGRPQETPRVSWVDHRRIRRRVLYPQPDQRTILGGVCHWHRSPEAINAESEDPAWESDGTTTKAQPEGLKDHPGDLAPKRQHGGLRETGAALPGREDSDAGRRVQGRVLRGLWAIPAGSAAVRSAVGPGSRAAGRPPTACWRGASPP